MILAVLFLLLVAPPSLMAQPASGSERAIRAARAASNDALATGDLEGFLASIGPEYVGTGGNGGHVRGPGELRELIGALFEDAPGTYFVRTPLGVRVSDDDQRAVETGRWVQVRPGERAEDAGGIGGDYTAYWRRGARGWEIHAELFVTLHGPGGG